MSRLLTAADLPHANPERIICHWTAGAYTASALDRTHYHFLIQGDGTVIRGVHSIAANDSCTDGAYAAHTLRCNTRSIGLAVCCMAGATARHFGKSPMTVLQWQRMAAVAAELAAHYRIPVQQKTVLGHFEVQQFLGIAQRGKWDPGVLPWAPNLNEGQVGLAFRALVLQRQEEIAHGAS